MTKIADLHKKWQNNPEYQEAYKNLAPEFELASAIITARTHAGMTQKELAERMNECEAVSHCASRKRKAKYHCEDVGAYC